MVTNEGGAVVHPDHSPALSCLSSYALREATYAFNAFSSGV